jgi:hypothetical protein
MRPEQFHGVKPLDLDAAGVLAALDSKQFVGDFRVASAG